MKATAPTTRDAGSVAQGLVAMWVAVASFSIADAIAKWQGQEGFAAVQIVFFRYFIGLIPVSIALYAAGLHQVRTSRPLAHILRGTLMSCALALFFWGLKYIPLAEAIPHARAVIVPNKSHVSVIGTDFFFGAVMGFLGHVWEGDPRH